MFKVKALYEYSSPHDDDLQFPVGQIITVTEEEDAEWYVGEYTDDAGTLHEGLFPRNFVEKYEPVAPPRPTRTRNKQRDSVLPAGAAQAAAAAAAAAETPVEKPASPPPVASPVASPQPVQAERASRAAAADEDEDAAEHAIPDKAAASPKSTSAFAAAPSSPPPTKEKEPEPKSPQSPAASAPAVSPPRAAPVSPVAAPAPAASVPKSPEPVRAEPIRAAAPPVASSPKPKPAPPPVADKPTGNSFRDRIAAFNKSAAPPITPFKPSGLGGGSSSATFIKKPFVAPPPSRNAFVPPPREVPAVKLYRRDEDPEIKERETENQETAEKAGIAPTAPNNGDDDEPKPMMSLKERMARLQREQQEQAHRHAEAAAKKEKPRRPPPKKRLESHESVPGVEAATVAGVAGAAGAAAGTEPVPHLDRRSTDDTIGRRSIEETPEHPPRGPPRRRSWKDPQAAPQDGNEADMSGAGDTTEGPDEESTERDDPEEKPRRALPTIPIILPAQPIAHKQAEDDESDEEKAAPEEEKAAAAGEQEDKETNEDAGEGEEEQEEEEEELDPEARRKEELRARMAKMSGGMGMMGLQGGMQGLFGAPPPVIARKKASTSEATRSSEATDDAATSPTHRAPPVPTMMALPGLAVRRSEEKPAAAAAAAAAAAPVQDEDEDEDEEEQSAAPAPAAARGAAPPVPGTRPVPPPPPPRAEPTKSQSEGSVSDDELSERTAQRSVETPRAETALPTSPPPPPSGHRGSEDAGSTSPGVQNKRASRLPPPIPGTAPAPPPAQTRPPPPPPPPGALSRASTSDSRGFVPPPRAAPTDGSDDDEEEEEAEGEEVTEYEGDYDTDIANPVPHKNSLKSHARDSSLEDNASLKSPISERTPSFPPPIPGTVRAPPPIPNQPPPPPSLPPSQPPPPPADKRRSVDVPRGPPPPLPPMLPPSQPSRNDADYDPYNYSSSPTTPGSRGVPIPGFPPPSRTKSFMEDASATPDLSFAPLATSPPAPAPPPPPPPPPTSSASRSFHPPGPPPPPPQAPAPAPSSSGASALHGSRGGGRQSMDLGGGGGGSSAAAVGAAAGVRTSMAPVRRSMDMARPAMESGFIANDLDLAPSSGWWLQANGLPPALQGRKDIYVETEEAQTPVRGGAVEVTRDVYVLYTDYSQTVITVQFAASGPVEGAQLSQRHEAPPHRLRQDQLEESYERFGRHIADAVLAKKDTVVGDGTSQALVLELIRPFQDALLPVGTRAYGALVYANLANASTTQTDEIRAGDVVTFRNTRFQGKHGAMHAKYSMEVGRPDHAAIVSEWDGTKKKVRAWEQGRESRKVKLESFKLDDLRSGEVKIWRVMPRSWVGWAGQN